MKQKDRDIIMHLRKDARISLGVISKNTGIPTSTIHDNMKRLFQNTIKGSSIFLDFSKFGYHYHSKMFIEVVEEEAFVTFLRDHKNINSLYELDNGFLVESFHRNVKEFVTFKKMLEGSFSLTRVDHFQVISCVEKEKFFV